MVIVFSLDFKKKIKNKIIIKDLNCVWRKILEFLVNFIIFFI